MTDTVLVPNDSSTPNLTVALSGTGDASAISVAGSGTFGTVPVGTTAGPNLVTVTNTSTTADLQIGNLQQIGADPEVFSIQNDTCSNQVIPAGGSNTCTFEVTFSPADAVPYSDTVLIPNDSANPNATLALSGTGELGTLTDSGDVDFLNVPVGTTDGPVTVTLTNGSATAEVMIGNLQQIGTNTANFTLLNDTCSNQTVAPLGTCTFDVTFTPDAVAAFSDTVLIPNDSSTPNLTVDLDGAGVAPALSSSGNLTFTDVPVGTTSAPQTVTITNTSTDAAVSIGELIRVGADTANFNILNDTCSNQSVAALGTCTFDVTCTPNSTATFNDTVQIPSDDPASPLLVTLTCNGLDSGLSANTPIFPDTLIQTSGTSQIVTVSNGAAAAPALIGTVSITGTDADNFHIVEDNCSNTTVAASGSCTISIAFDPDLVQAYSANLSIPSNAQSGPLNIPLAGNGVAPTLVVSPASPFDYGDVPINAPSLAGVQTFTLDNTSVDPSGNLNIGTISLVGSNPDQFAIVEDNCSNTLVSFGSNCTMEVAFLPTATGLQQAALSIPSNDPANPVLVHDIEGTGIASAVSVTPASPFDFLTVPVDTASAPQTFTIENTGTAPLSLGQLALVGTDPFNFAITADACSNTILAPAATCDYDVTFFPENDVSYTATVTIPSNDPASPFSYTVTGTGIIPGLAANPTALAFGNQDVATSSAPQSVTLTNAGAADVTVANVSLVGTNPDDFEIVQDACSGQTLIPAGTCQVRGVFSPESAGAKNAALLVLSDDADNPFLSVALTGTGIVPGAPLVSLAPTVLDFDNVEPNTTTIQNVTLTNTGTGTLTVSAVAVGGSNPQPFSNSGDCVGASLGAGQSCTEAVTFAPGTEENFNAVLNFTTNVPQQPSFVVLIGSSAVDNSGCALGGSGTQGGGKALGYGFLLLCLTLAGLHRRWARVR
ncbi:choice-of-anchor D domain-containing protein [bacterium]|nr:MAG: choice-of-anchor D domain-containing protein [bacterium]